MSSHAATADLATVARLPAPSAKAARRIGVIGVALLFGLVAVALLHGAADRFGVQSCRIEPGLPRFGAETETTMRVSRATACQIGVRAASLSIDDVTIIKSPSHGTLRMRGRTGVIYQPAGRFVGEDSFAFQITGHEGGVSKTSIAWVRVNVQ